MSRSNRTQSGSRPPVAPKKPHAVERHGIVVTDDYAWLKDDNWQAVLKNPALLSPEIRAYLEAENSYAEDILGPTAGLQAELVAEMRGRIKEDDSSVPLPDGPFAYFRKYRVGGQHELIGRLPRQGGSEAVILDGDALASRSAYFKFGGARHSPDHRLEAWSADIAGSEFFTIRVREWDSGRDLTDIVEHTEGNLVWTADSKAFLYVKVDDHHRPLQVCLHRLGTSQSEDIVVYREPDSGWFTRIRKSATGRFCIIAGGDHQTSEQRLVDLTSPTAPPRLVAARQADMRYTVDDHGNRLFILTNADGAVDFKIVAAPLANPTRDHWTDVIPHRPGTYILSMDVYAGHMVRLERSNALPSIVIRELASTAEHAVAFDEAAYALDTGASYEFDTPVMRFSYSSMTTPSEIYDYDMATRTRTLRKRQHIPSGHDPANYVTKRLFAKGHDGVEIPISILHRADFVCDGRAPLLLYGYGAYGISIPASFSANRLSLVDRGLVYAIAHIRGGTEKGWSWYVDGKRDNKPNTFRDFISCARALIDARYTAPGRIVAHGGSAGGMLMGAVANLSPELFAGIIAEVPFVDVLGTMLDDALPLTPPEWPEWGNPIVNEGDFRTILAYSPYDNIGAHRYPAILALAGIADPRVTYWEPAKWIAKLRAVMSSGGPALLRTNMGAGHGGASGRFSRLDEVALCYAFALSTVKA